MPTLTVERTQSFSAHVPAGGARLFADVTVPPDSLGVVLFIHGGTSGRRSTRNRYIAGELNMIRLATVLVDLLTPDEEMLDSRTAALRFDIPFLTERTVRMLDWLRTFEPVRAKPVGLFGASTGAAAALDASVRSPDQIRAVVSRAGRTDLACELQKVRVPTLLIVGEDDTPLLECCSKTLLHLRSRGRLEVVPGASHQFGEPGALERVAGLAGAWYHEHFE